MKAKDESRRSAALMFTDLVTDGIAGQRFIMPHWLPALLGRTLLWMK